MKNLQILGRKLRKLPKRLLIQLALFFTQNPLITRFFSGQIYEGRLKSICTPGLNCFSCPAAVYSCPIGAFQLFLAGAKNSLSLFVTGFLLAVGAIFGRFICGFLCPMGFLQDLLYKIKTPKLKVRMKYPSYLKYVILVVFVILLPLSVRHWLVDTGLPWFCKYICPSGTIFGAIPLLASDGGLRSQTGALFILKMSIAVGVVVAAVFISRFFCRVLCPLGAIYSLFNKFSFFRIHFKEEKCTSCQRCTKACDLCLDPVKEPNSPECVRCGNCVRACHAKALTYGTVLPPRQEQETLKQ